MNKNTNFSVRLTLALVLGLAVLGCTPQPEESARADLHFIDAASAQQQLANGRLTSVALVQHYLHNIAAHNQNGHNIRAILEVNPEALTIAERLDTERANGQLRGPLHGLPVIVKGNIATADSMATTAGARVLEGFITAEDAEVIAQLRAQGAIILGKANLSEWANFRGANSISGWSSLGGQTRNPYLLTHNACGSSSGSGAGIAADFSLLAIGTETDGSIMCPTSINGIVGIKPTRGAVSGHGIIPIASAQDIAGPMTRYVFDAALLLDAMATTEAQQQFGGSLASAAQQPYAGGPVVVVRAYDQRFDSVQALTNHVVASLQSQGIEVIEVTEWRLPPSLGQAELEVLIYEFKRDLERWFTDFSAPIGTMQDVIDFNLAHAESELALFGQEYFELAAAIDLAGDYESYATALALSRQLAEEHLNRYLVDLGASAIVLPAYGPSWPIPPVEGPGYSFGTSTPAAVAGYPAITIPGKFEGVLPVGLSIIGKPWSEASIIALASQLETSLGGFQPPQFIQNLEALAE